MPSIPGSNPHHHVLSIFIILLGAEEVKAAGSQRSSDRLDKTHAAPFAASVQSAQQFVGQGSLRYE